MDKDKEMQDYRSESDDSQIGASTETPFESPTSQSPNEDPPQTPRPKGGGKGGRRPAPKNLINTPNGGTTVVGPSASGAGRDIPARFELPSIVDRARDSALISRGGSPFLQLHPASVGAQRDHVMRGNVRAAPYPSPVVTPRSASSSISTSSTSDRDHQRASTTYVDARYRNGHPPSIQSQSREAPTQHGQQQQQKQQSYFGPGSYASQGNSAYIHQPSNFGNNDRYDSVSPQSPLSTLSPATHPVSQLPSCSSQFPNHFSRTSDVPTQPGGTVVNHSRPAHPLSASSIPGPSSSLSNRGGSYGFAAYANRQTLTGTGTLLSSSAKPATQNGAYANPLSWSSSQSLGNHTEPPNNRR